MKTRNETKESCKEGEHLNKITRWFALRTKTGIARLKYIKDKERAGIKRIPWRMGSLMKETNKLINRKGPRIK